MPLIETKTTFAGRFLDHSCLSTGCTRIFQGCTTVVGCTRCVLIKNSHIVSHVMFFALDQC